MKFTYSFIDIDDETILVIANHTAWENGIIDIAIKPEDIFDFETWVLTARTTDFEQNENNWGPLTGNQGCNRFEIAHKDVVRSILNSSGHFEEDNKLGIQWEVESITNKALHPQLIYNIDPFNDVFEEEETLVMGYKSDWDKKKYQSDYIYKLDELFLEQAFNAANVHSGADMENTWIIYNAGEKQALKTVFSSSAYDFTYDAGFCKK